jgi:hypothetical protein
MLLLYPTQLPDKRVVKWFLDNTASDLAPLRFLSVVCVPRMIESIRLKRNHHSDKYVWKQTGDC